MALHGGVCPHVPAPGRVAALDATVEEEEEEEETKGPALLEPAEMEDMNSPSIPTNPEPRAPKTIPAIPAAAPQPPSFPSIAPREAQTGRWTPPNPAGIGGNPLRTSQPKPAAGDFPSGAALQPPWAPTNPRPDCSGAADQPAHQGKIPVFLFYSLCLLPRREPTGTNTL